MKLGERRLPRPGELVVAFDADDTLWHNEGAFGEVESLFDELVAPWADSEHAQAALLAHERRRVGLYGYGVKSFALSMIATACELSNDEIGARDLRRFVAAADHLLSLPTELIDGAREAMAEIGDSHPTMIVTKGDLHHQQRRLADAQVTELCFDVEVVSEKDAPTYSRLLARHRITPGDFVMVGNSVVSDVAPVLEIGARAIHIPYATTWALETAERDPDPSPRWARLDSITQVPKVIADWATRAR